MDKTHIINEIRRTAKNNGGKPLGKLKFYSETCIRESDWAGKYWLKWSEAVREAGYQPNKKQEAFDENWLLEKLAGLVRELGHYPVSNELRMKAREDNNFPSHNVFSRFGRKAAIASALLTWCESNSGWSDIEALCAPIAEVATDNQDKEMLAKTTEYGYVYLLKSGKYYKIGRSNSPGRREYELSIQLPEKVKTVHTIKTDDPVGIEAYWHRRFLDRRKNGEWFELRGEDVTAFRRRKFM